MPVGWFIDHVAKWSCSRADHRSLPPLQPRQKPRPIIDYVKTTRQSLLKYLAVLRWKSAVDSPIASSAAQGSDSTAINGASFPTPLTNGELDTSPAAYVVAGKGKSRAFGIEETKPVLRGKVTDTKRIQQFMEHQNRQHEEAIMHVKHTAKVVEGLRFVILLRFSIIR
jgi:mediator of RNA polymerase II transcription subunit 14